MIEKFEETFEKSFARIIWAKDYKNFFTVFYENFFESSPEVRQKFEMTDMIKQMAMMRKSFMHFINHGYNIHTDEEIKNLAASHSKEGYDIPPNLYEFWLNALIRTIEKFDPEFDQNVETSWRLKLKSLVDYMLSRYDLKEVERVSE